MVNEGYKFLDQVKSKRNQEQIGEIRAHKVKLPMWKSLSPLSALEDLGLILLRSGAVSYKPEGKNAKKI